jgi:uncharacterized protein
MNFYYSLCGCLTGLIVGLTGVGGGALMTPILLLVFGVAPTTAVATDLWFAGLTKIIGVKIHHRHGQVDWTIVKRLWWGSLPSSLAVIAFIFWSGPIQKFQWLTQIIGVVVVVTALGLLWRPFVDWLFQKTFIEGGKLLKKSLNVEEVAPGLTIESSQHFFEDQEDSVLKIVLTILSGIVLGVLVALTSIGAGALGSALLLHLYPHRMTPHRLVATDIMHAIPLALVAGVGYLFAGLVDGKMLFYMLLGSVPGVILGSHLACKTSSKWLKIALATVLLIVGIKSLS